MKLIAAFHITGSTGLFFPSTSTYVQYAELLGEHADYMSAHSEALMVAHNTERAHAQSSNLFFRKTAFKINKIEIYRMESSADYSGSEGFLQGN